MVIMRRQIFILVVIPRRTVHPAGKPAGKRRRSVSANAAGSNKTNSAENCLQACILVYDDRKHLRRYACTKGTAGLFHPKEQQRIPRHRAFLCHVPCGKAQGHTGRTAQCRIVSGGNHDSYRKIKSSTVTVTALSKSVFCVGRTRFFLVFNSFVFPLTFAYFYDIIKLSKESENV